MNDEINHTFESAFYSPGVVLSLCLKNLASDCLYLANENSQSNETVSQIKAAFGLSPMLH